MWPLTRHTRKEVLFSLNSKCERSFKKLKEKLITTPVLVILDPNQNYEVFYDASRKGLGCVLMKNSQVVAYASRQLKTREKNYKTRDVELSMIIVALKVWRHHPCKVHFKIFSDHNILKYLFGQKKLNMHQ